MKYSLLVILVCCTNAFAYTSPGNFYATADSGDDKIVLSDKGLQINFLHSASGFGVSSIINPTTGYDFLNGEAKVENIWKIKLRNAQNEILLIDNTVECDRSYTREKSKDGKTTSLHLYWNDIEIGGEKDALDVEVRVRVEGSGMSFWNIKVINNSKEYRKQGKGFGVWEMIFPAIRGLKAAKSDNMQLAIPNVVGKLLQNPIERMPVRIAYPSMHCEMQFCTLFNSDGKNGLIMGTFDPQIYTKLFLYDRDQKDTSLKYEIKHYPEGMGQSANGYEMPYEAVIGVYQGDWITACKIYRNWAVNQFWCSKGNLTMREDIPRWYKDITIWFSGLYTDRMVPLAKYLDVPVAFQWYKWNVLIDPNKYSPDAYFASEEFQREANELKNAGIKITPYINSRLWNTDTKSWHEEKPYPAASKGLCQPVDVFPLGGLHPERNIKDPVYMYTEHWEKARNETDWLKGSTEAVMCPYTEFWQKANSEIVKRLSSEYKVDGVYLDQISAAEPVLCFDPEHGHSLGGGNYWTRGYRNLIELCKKNSPGVILTSEDRAEAYLDLLDGNLACNATGNGPDLIPMFHYVYKDYCILFGRMSGDHWNEWDGDIYSKGLPLLMRNAQMFTWGEQLGWFNPNILDFPGSEAEYIKTLCQSMNLESVKKFLFYGEMVRPPILSGDYPVFAAKWRAGQKETEMPAVLHSAWKANDGSLGLVFTNMDTVDHKVDYSVDLKQFQLPSAKQYRLKVIGGNAPGKPIIYKSGNISRVEIIGARNYLVIEIEAVD